MASKVVLGDVLVDCDDEKKLREFYAELLGWESCERYGQPAVRSGSGCISTSGCRPPFGGAHFTTMLDPAGHPFCLCAEE